jgi:hypothetical protein
MLFAKVNPPAESIQQITPFSAVTNYASFMSAYARPYALGTTKVNFEVVFGNIKFDDQNNPVGFQNMISSNLQLTGAQIESWGTDDSVVLQEIATLMGVNIEEYVSVPDNQGPR